VFGRLPPRSPAAVRDTSREMVRKVHILGSPAVLGWRSIPQGGTFSLFSALRFTGRVGGVGPLVRPTPACNALDGACQTQDEPGSRKGRRTALCNAAGKERPQGTPPSAPGSAGQ
jgi:hypothetical protein